MNKLLLFLQSKQLQIASVSMLIASVVFVVYLYPREAKFKYEFQKGKPWLYEDLVARFDFPILKTEKELAQEKRDARSNRTLFFTRLNNVSEENLETFKQRILKFWDSNNEDSIVTRQENRLQLATTKEALQILTELYKQGILKPFDLDESNEYGQVLLESDGFSKNIAINNLLTMSEAGALLKRKISASENNDELKKVQSLLINNLDYNVIFNKETTAKFYEEQLNSILPVKNMVQRGELIIIKGSLVDDDKYAKLSSLRQAYSGNVTNKNRVWYILSGQILIVGVLYIALLFFLLQYRKQIMEDISKFTFILLNIALIVLLGKFTLSFGVEYMYLAPFPILPIILRSFFDTRLALFCAHGCYHASGLFCT